MIIKFILLSILSYAGFEDKIYDAIYNDELVNCPATRLELEKRLDKIEKLLIEKSKKFKKQDWNKLLLSQSLEGQFITFFIADRAPDVDYAPAAKICIEPFKKFKKEMTEKNLNLWKDCVDNQFRDPLLVPEQIQTCFLNLKK